MGRRAAGDDGTGEPGEAGRSGFSRQKVDERGRHHERVDDRLYSSVRAFWLRHRMSFEPRDYLRHILIEADYLIDPACARFTCSTPRHRFSLKRTPILTSGATWTGIRT
jgi:hypothetical protein